MFPNSYGALIDNVQVQPFQNLGFFFWSASAAWSSQRDGGAAKPAAALDGTASKRG